MGADTTAIIRKGTTIPQKVIQKLGYDNLQPAMELFEEFKLIQHKFNIKLKQYCKSEKVFLPCKCRKKE